MKRRFLQPKYIIPFFVICIFLAFGAWLFAYVWHWQNRPHVLEIYCFALDKSGNSPGNLAVFIRTPDNHTILIDGGKSGAILRAISGAMPFYERNIDTIISTNPDDSHITGLTEVVDRYRVSQVIEMVAIDSASSSAETVFENMITDKKIPERKVSIGDKVDFADPALSTHVLFPPSVDAASSTPFKFSKTNQPVLAFSIHYGSTVIIFGGDLSKTEQKYVGQDIAQEMASSSLSTSSLFVSSSTLLILPHAENSGVSDESFFNALNPNYVVVSKKPRLPSTPTATANTRKKPAKPPFDISTIPNLSITNLFTDGDAEFISSGVSFIKKKL